MPGEERNPVPEAGALQRQAATGILAPLTDVIAKTYGTLDRVSGGRLSLGVGVGSLREEFGMLSAS